MSLDPLGDDWWPSAAAFLREADAADAELAVKAEPFCYLATGKAPGAIRSLICPACAVDVPEEGYEFLKWFEPNPTPMSEADARGWAEGHALTCSSCSEEIGR